MRLFSSLTIVCALTLVGFAAQAQRTATRVIVGDVADVTGAPIAGATVRLSRPNFTARTTATDQKGRFRFDNVPAATYEIEVVHAGFATLQRPVIVRANDTQNITLRLTLHPHPASQELSRDAAKEIPPNAAPVQEAAASPPVRVGGNLSGSPSGRSSAGVPGSVVGGVSSSTAEAPPPPAAPTAASRQTSGVVTTRVRPTPRPTTGSRTTRSARRRWIRFRRSRSTSTPRPTRTCADS